MLGFIKKDLLVIKGNLKLIFLYLLIFGMTTLSGNDNFIFIPAFLSAMLVISTFSYDDYNKWDAYAITLPNGRRDIVKAKYLTTLLLVLCGSILCYIFGIISLFIGGFTIDSLIELFVTVLGVALGSLLIPSLCFPLIYKFGVEKGRMSLFVIILVLTMIFGVFFVNIDFENIENLGNILSMFYKYGIYIFMVFLILLFYVSYKISTIIYNKKEF